MVNIMQPLSVQKKGRIRLITNPQLARKLFSMGILPGLEIQILRKGPFGKTYYCIVNHHQKIALRKMEADSIYIV